MRIRWDAELVDSETGEPIKEADGGKATMDKMVRRAVNFQYADEKPAHPPEYYLEVGEIITASKSGGDLGATQIKFIETAVAKWPITPAVKAQMLAILREKPAEKAA